MSKYKGTKVQIPGAVSFYWQLLFTILRTSEYASYFSPILAGFEHRNRKNCLKNHGLPDRAKTSIFVTSAPRASFWPSLTKFHFWLFPSLGDSKAKLVLTTKWLLWTPSNHHILGSLTSLGLNFGHVCSIEGFFNF